jgi:hypothetical protein
MTQFHENILAEPQQRVLRTLGPFATKHGYYLADGTAVALRLGHRESIDFDFFALDPALHGAALRDELTVILPGLQTSQASDGTFDGVADGVKVSYFRYKYPLLDTPDHWAEYGVDVAGLRDLAAMKLSAIAQRGAKKDFIDLHTMLATGMTLSAMFGWYRKRFKAMDLMPVRMGLVYFDDAEPQEMPVMNIPADWATMKRDIAVAARSMGGGG